MGFEQTQNNQGFTLVEVLASLVLVSLILLTFSQGFIFATKAAVSNNEKLVATHLAKGTLERIKFDPFSYINEPVSQANNYELEPVRFDRENCPARIRDCSQLFSFSINNKMYQIAVIASQSLERNDQSLRLINIVVDVELANSSPPIVSRVEGYVPYE